MAARNGKVLESEFHHGSAGRSFTLDTDVDVSKAEASYDNGILRLTLPKKPGSTATTLAVE